MSVVFASLFYIGAVLIAIGLSGALWCHKHEPGLRKYAGFLTLLGFVLILATVLDSRRGRVDRGPQMTWIQGEKYITLTDWNGNGYTMLRAHPETTVLKIANADVTDQTLDHVAEMVNLRELDLNGSQTTDAGLSKLAKLGGLETLRLRGTKITDHGLIEHLGPLPNLELLDVRETAVTPAAVEHWLSMAPGRRALY